MKKLHVTSLCNALMDILLEVEHADIQNLALRKGEMHLVDDAKQQEVLQYLNGRERHVELGGSAMNAMRGVSFLGGKTAFAGMVGRDEFGRKIQERMSELRIDAHLGQTDAAHTGICVVLVTPDGERTMVTSLGASRLYTEHTVPAAAIADADVFHHCGYQWDTSTQRDAILRAVNLAKKSGVKVSFDVSDPFVVRQHRETFATFIENEADIVFANEEEAKLLFGLEAEETAEKIAKTGAIAVIKLGAKGALIRSPEETIQVAPVPTKVVDTTGAGDMFAGGFLYGLTHGKPLAECGRLGASLASNVISRIGAVLV